MAGVRSRKSYKMLLEKLDILLVPCQYIFSVIIFFCEYSGEIIRLAGQYVL